MSSNRAGERGRLIIGLLLALAWVLAPTCAAAKPAKAHPPKQDEGCLACHGTAGMKSGKGKDISINPAKHAASAHAVLTCQDCHTSLNDFPHPAKIPKVACATCHDAEAKSFATSAHSVLNETGCATCHGNVHELTAAANLMPAKCSECHEPELQEFADSIHGQAAKRGDSDAPKCVSCHGEIHTVKSASEPDSAVARKNLADSCATCHSDTGFLSRHKIPVAHPVESYKQSVHGRAIAAGNEKAADCNSCHGNHNIYPARDERSRVNHWNVSQTCGEGHGEIAKIYSDSVHGVAVRAGV